MRSTALLGPGSFLWLLRHDIMLGHRSMRASSRRSGRVAVAILGGVVALLLVAGFVSAPVISLLSERFRTEALLAGTVVLTSVFALFMSKAMSQATDTLHDRGDLDLLLSSPLPMGRVLTTRLLAIALVSAIMPIMLAFPFVGGMLLRGYATWVGVFPVVVGLGLIAASTGAAITFGLLALIGPRWTPIASRVLATAFGIAALLVSQSQFLFPGVTSSPAWLALVAQARDGAHGLMWWPTRALLGEPLPMAALLAASIAVLVLVSAILGRAYAHGVLGQLALPAGRSAADLTRGFGGSPFRTLLRKEALLMVRHPGLGANLAYQVVFLLPGIIMARRVGEVTGTDAATAVVLMTVMLTGRIARIVAAGPFGSDESAALATTSPVPARDVLLAKWAVSASLLAAVLGASLAVVWLHVPAALPATAIAATAAATARLWLASGQELPLRRVGLHGRFSGDTTALPGSMFDLCWGIAGVALALAL